MNKIKEARLKTGLSRAEVARLLKMPYRTLENWENDVRYPANYIERLILKEIKQYIYCDEEVSKEIVTNEWGVDLDFDNIVSYMDDEIREQVHEELVMQSDKDCTAQEFFDAYCKAYEDATGEEWEFAKENPVY